MQALHHCGAAGCNRTQSDQRCSRCPFHSTTACYAAPVWHLPTLYAAWVLAAPMGPQPNATRGEAVFDPQDRHAFGVAATARLAVLAGTSRRLIQPVGFGFGFHLRYFGTVVWPVRLGVEVVAGHSQAYERIEVPLEEGVATTTVRYASLGHTDFSGGVAIQLAVRPVVIEAAAGAGLAVSTFDRPWQAAPDWTGRRFDVSPMVYGHARVGVPIRGNHGVVVGGGIQQIFSRTSVPVEPDSAEEASPFDLVVLVTVGYQFWF